MFHPPETTLTFTIAGVQYRPQSVILKALKEGLGDNSPLFLVGEPSNRFDSNAVKILYKDNFIGYVPKPINESVWKSVKAGYKPNAIITKYEPDAPTYEMFHVKVTFSKADV